VVGDEEGREERLEELREHRAIFGAALRCAVAVAPTFRCGDGLAFWSARGSRSEVRNLSEHLA
jgi:hypothetical protein